MLGNYEIVAPIAGGGMGMVYRAEHAVLRTPHAIKVLMPSLAHNERVGQRFRQEAYVQAQLKHDGIVRATDFVEQGATVAIVMDLVDGPALEALLLERPGPWSLKDTMAVMTPVLDAMAFAHARGVVHRDLKPGNVLLDRTDSPSWPGIPRITDFGLAKILATDGAMTRTGTQMGTVPYMAPEQFEGKTDLDAHADVFALGMMLWRLLAGRLPAPPEDMRAVLSLYTGTVSIPMLTDVVPTAPEHVSRAVAAAVALEPKARIPDAGRLLEALRAPVIEVAPAPRPAPEVPEEPVSALESPTPEPPTSEAAAKSVVPPLSSELGREMLAAAMLSAGLATAVCIYQFLWAVPALAAVSIANEGFAAAATAENFVWQLDMALLGLGSLGVLLAWSAPTPRSDVASPLCGLCLLLVLVAVGGLLGLVHA